MIQLNPIPCNANLGFGDPTKPHSFRKCSGILVPVTVRIDYSRTEHLNYDIQQITWKCSDCGKKINGDPR